MGPKKIENSKRLLLDCSIDGDNMNMVKRMKRIKKGDFGTIKKKTCPYNYINN